MFDVLMLRDIQERSEDACPPPPTLADQWVDLFWQRCQERDDARWWQLTRAMDALQAGEGEAVEE